MINGESDFFGVGPNSPGLAIDELGELLPLVAKFTAHAVRDLIQVVNILENSELAFVGLNDLKVFEDLDGHLGLHH